MENNQSIYVGAKRAEHTMIIPMRAAISNSVAVRDPIRRFEYRRGLDRTADIRQEVSSRLARVRSLHYESYCDVYNSYAARQSWSSLHREANKVEVNGVPIVSIVLAMDYEHVTAASEPIKQIQANMDIQETPATQKRKRWTRKTQGVAGGKNTGNLTSIPEKTETQTRRRKRNQLKGIYSIPIAFDFFSKNMMASRDKLKGVVSQEKVFYTKDWTKEVDRMLRKLRKHYQVFKWINTLSGVVYNANGHTVDTSAQTWDYIVREEKLEMAYMKEGELLFFELQALFEEAPEDLGEMMALKLLRLNQILTAERMTMAVTLTCLLKMSQAIPIIRFGTNWLGTTPNPRVHPLCKTTITLQANCQALKRFYENVTIIGLVTSGIPKAMMEMTF
ncbi:ethylene response sensor 1 [Striga asiatica]|uniref:Ethylene response sensor 1 n=1 Tax=Striga asiatica TaxID=4170 RepID=A0A5A7QW73_STRAF|nr:ethylene response sensor 1 [Striga asiatica]